VSAAPELISISATSATLGGQLTWLASGIPFPAVMEPASVEGRFKVPVYGCLTAAALSNVIGKL